MQFLFHLKCSTKSYSWNLIFIAAHCFILQWNIYVHPTTSRMISQLFILILYHQYLGLSNWLLIWRFRPQIYIYMNLLVPALHVAVLLEIFWNFSIVHINIISSISRSFKLAFNLKIQATNIYMNLLVPALHVAVLLKIFWNSAFSIPVLQ